MTGNRNILLPNSDGQVTFYQLRSSNNINKPKVCIKSRIAYAAPHVVCNPLADVNTNEKPVIDWEATLSYRHYLWSLGLGVGEAMDTAQRGMGLDWETTTELIDHSLREAKSVGGNITCGAGTDHLLMDYQNSLDDVVRAYLDQCEFIEARGGRVILMASRALAACAKSSEDYRYVYNHLLSNVKQPVILHWLGEMFDPALAGYWGHHNIDDAMQVCLEIIHMNSDRVHGIKMSLLDAEKEIQMRRSLPQGIHLFTGDDFNYLSLIRGDEYGYSDALLGIFNAIAPAASAALYALDNKDYKQYDRIMTPTIPLARHIFKAPTYYYKTGIVFMAYLNGHQSHFRMVGGMESARSIVHLSELFKLADQAGLLIDPDLALYRMKGVLKISGL